MKELVSCYSMLDAPVPQVDDLTAAPSSNVGPTAGWVIFYGNPARVTFPVRPEFDASVLVKLFHSPLDYLRLFIICNTPIDNLYFPLKVDKPTFPLFSDSEMVDLLLQHDRNFTKYKLLWLYTYLIVLLSRITAPTLLHLTTVQSTALRLKLYAEPPWFYWYLSDFNSSLGQHCVLHFVFPPSSYIYN